MLSTEEVLRLLDAATPPRDRVLLQVAYGCGLRLNELLHLRVTDIDRTFCPGRWDTAETCRLMMYSRSFLPRALGHGPGAQ